MSSLAPFEKCHDATLEPISPPEALEKCREELSARMAAYIAAANDEDYDAIAEDFFAPEFKARFDNVPQTLSGSETLQLLRERRQCADLGDSPFIEVKQTWVEVLANGRQGSITMDMEVAGAPEPNLKVRCLATYRWKRVDGKWVCYHHQLMNGATLAAMGL